jgi:hypothetical protein
MGRQFHFLIAAEAAKQLAADMEAYPFRGPVHDRIIAELRKPATDREDDGSGFVGPHVLCSVEPRDQAVLQFWTVDPTYADRPWVEALKLGLDDGAYM